MLRKSLIVLLSLSVPAPGFASTQTRRPSHARGLVHGEATVAPLTGAVDTSFFEKAFRDGVSRSSTVFNAEYRGMTAALTSADLRQERPESEDETACVAEATKRSEEAIQRKCETASPEECETARRANAALLRAELLKCREEYVISETDSATARERHEAERDYRLGERAKTKNTVRNVLGVVAVGVLVYIGLGELGWIGGDAAEE